MACNLQLLMFCACTATLANALSVPQSSVPLPSRPLVSCHSTNYYYGAGTATRKITTSCNLRTQRQRRTYRKNIFALYLSDLDEMNADEGGIDQVELDEEDLDAFVEDLFAEVSDIAASPSFSGNETASLEIESPIAFSPLEDIVSSEQKDKDSPFFVQRQAAVGIGGNAGFVYDVNSLKRNLVQESVRRSKQELLALLGDGRQDEMISSSAAKDGKMNMVVVPQRWKRDRDDLIEERLSSLVQSNPVSTTTDSNLLDGKWSFAFATNSASSILDTSRFLLSKTKRVNDEIEGDNKNNNQGASVRGGPWRFRSGKTENPFRSSTRQIFLEDLADDEDAHLIDKTRVFGGLFQISRRYGVFGLTRTALDLDLVESETRIFGLPIKRKSMADFKGTKYGAPLELQILYLDSDLCICTTGAGLYGPLHVYTKSDLWVTEGAKRKMRLLAGTASSLTSIQSPLRIRQRLRKIFANDSGDKTLLTESELKALNIGELDINEDGKTREDPSWDGEDDPFYHLTPAERMEVLKKMSLQDIYGAALKRKMQSKKEKKRWVRRSKKFKRPDP